jgi:hypothetical protein
LKAADKKIIERREEETGLRESWLLAPNANLFWATPRFGSTKISFQFGNKNITKMMLLDNLFRNDGHQAKQRGHVLCLPFLWDKVSCPFRFMPKARTDRKESPLKLFDIAKAEGRPLYTCAPMVRYSKVSIWVNRFWEGANGLKLAFRETVAHYGVDLAWTPMVQILHLIVENKVTEIPFRFWQRNLIAANMHVIVVSTW